MAEIGLLRFITCGSVDDGKSTLIGRLLYDTQLILEDQAVTLARDSRRHGTTGDDIDLALLVDGLQAEREQGITIDVAYRFITTPPSPLHRGGHAGSRAIHPQHGDRRLHRRPSRAAGGRPQRSADPNPAPRPDRQPARHPPSRAGGEQDRPGGLRPSRVRRHHCRLRQLQRPLGFCTVTPIPISARYGDNVASHSDHMPWYSGPSLLGHLEQIEVTDTLTAQPFRMHVQWVSRPSLDFRGYCGTIATGQLPWATPSAPPAAAAVRP